MFSLLYLANDKLADSDHVCYLSDDLLPYMVYSRIHCPPDVYNICITVIINCICIDKVRGSNYIDLIVLVTYCRIFKEIILDDLVFLISLFCTKFHEYITIS